MSTYDNSSEGSVLSDGECYFSEDDKMEARCLFCPHQHAFVHVILGHMRSVHSFDLIKYRNDGKLSFYQMVACINYLRSSYSVVSADGPVVVDIPVEELNRESNLAPVLNPDKLIYALEDIDDENEEEEVLMAARVVQTPEMELEAWKEKYRALEREFADYRESVQSSYFVKSLRDGDRPMMMSKK